MTATTDTDDNTLDAHLKLLAQSIGRLKLQANMTLMVRDLSLTWTNTYQVQISMEFRSRYSANFPSYSMPSWFQRHAIRKVFRGITERIRQTDENAKRRLMVIQTEFEQCFADREVQQSGKNYFRASLKFELFGSKPVISVIRGVQYCNATEYQNIALEDIKT